MRQKLSVVRLMRLQVKSGYIAGEPLEYQVFRTAPPVKLLRSEMYVKETVPYRGLITKAMRKNPSLADEKINPFYGSLDSRALILAKKQYMYMKQGFSEDDAYIKAVRFVEEMEDRAYLDLVEIEKEIATAGATSSYYTNADTAQELVKWQEKLKLTPYDSLSLEDQGSLDKFIQTKILKWNEIERERRMKDVIFYSKFRSLLDSLFPSNSKVNVIDPQNRNEFFSKFMQLHGHEESDATTSSPFFVEEYVRFFERLINISSSYLQEEWTHAQEWISETVAFQTELAKTPTLHTTELMFKFFPFLLLRSCIDDMITPTVDQIRSLLYHNGIGYKPLENKLFVKRFYKIPQLLFPLELFSVQFALNYGLYYQFCLGDDEVLRKEMKANGIPDRHFDKVKNLLTVNKPTIASHHRGFQRLTAIDLLQSTSTRRVLSPSRSTKKEAKSRRRSTGSSVLNELLTEAESGPEEEPPSKRHYLSNRNLKKRGESSQLNSLLQEREEHGSDNLKIESAQGSTSDASSVDGELVSDDELSSENSSVSDDSSDSDDESDDEIRVAQKYNLDEDDLFGLDNFVSNGTRAVTNTDAVRGFRIFNELAKDNFEGAERFTPEQRQILLDLLKNERLFQIIGGGRDEDEEVLQKFAKSDELPTSSNTPLHLTDDGKRLNDEEWDALLHKYSLKTITALEKARRQHFIQSKDESPENFVTEGQLKQYREKMALAEVQLRARLSIIYDRKEAARKVEEEKARDPICFNPLIEPLLNSSGRK